RAGRLGPGVCYRLYSKHDLHSMQPFTKPEILVSDVSPLALDLAVWGVKDPHTLSWLDMPPAPAWDSGLRLLQALGALDSSGSVTSAGRTMARLPLHPRLSRLMMRAEQLGCVRLGTDLAAILTERDIFRYRGMDRIISKPDISERVDVLHKWRKQKESGESTDPSADVSALRAVERTSRQLMRLVPEKTDCSTQDIENHDAISRILLSAYPDSICKRREEGGGRFVHVQGRGLRLSLDSHLGSSPYIIAVHADAGEKTEGFVHMAAPVTEELIRSECANLIETNRRVEWDRKEGRIVAAVEARLGALLLSTRRLTPADEEAAPILCEVIRTIPGILTFSKDARQFQGRVGLMRRTFPEETWPDLSDEQLLSKPEEWLLPWFGGIRSAQDLSGLNILSALKATLSWERQRILDERAPVSIIVPSGHGVTLDYASGDLPILAVKLQEMFGLADTPMIAAGRIKILLHLLSPARRPVQITQDLKGFWNNGYPQVKKDLKGRYPKHPWPDDPWNAVPTRRTKPRRH
ncbi:MAG TPA: ATP-dependent helicase C-terminal domain-containing protein, partial [Nitrospirota bacterium]|nr:ATP-dependent helicase C-terminal domain-containing protein [Nitrospirota bacterium]